MEQGNYNVLKQLQLYETKFKLVSDIVICMVQGIRKTQTEIDNIDIDELVVETIRNFYIVYRLISQIKEPVPLCGETMETVIPWFVNQSICSIETFSRVIDRYGQLPIVFNDAFKLSKHEASELLKCG